MQIFLASADEGDIYTLNMRIPIQNIYYLLSYAWNTLEESRLVRVQPLRCETLLDLFAKVLLNGMNYLLRCGLDRGYAAQWEECAALRGRVDFTATLKKTCFALPRVICAYDEFEHNVLPNQIIITTLEHLRRTPEIDPNLRRELSALTRRLTHIDRIVLEKRYFGLVQLHSNNAFYRFLLHICELIHDNLFLSEETGGWTFRDFVRDERKMAVLFETFVRNFYKREQSQFSVSRETLFWEATPLTEQSHDFLPQMQTDITLTSPARKIIIDTKYYLSPLQTYYEKDSVRSMHLFQIHAYMTNLPSHEKARRSCEGILLYPKVQQDLDLHYDLTGYQLRVRTLDLSQPDWKKIHRDLLAMIDIS